MVLISESYLVCSCSRAWSGNLSWQDVDSMNWSVCVWGRGGIGVWHSMSSPSFAWHWHGVGAHVDMWSRVFCCRISMRCLV